MAIKSYIENDKKLFEVYVNGFDSRGRRFQRRKGGLETLQRAKTLEFELKRDLAKLKEEAVPYRWHEWFDECMKRMKVEMKPSTVYNYQTQIKKWIHPHWKNREIQLIIRTDVHEMIYEHCAAIISPNNRKTILKMVKRLFAMALEEGLIDRNPCVGIQVKAPEVEQKVFTMSEVETFLREAKINEHRFYPIWALALMTGMRSGELYALQWPDIDLESRIIRVTKQWTNKNGIGPTKTQRSRVVPVSDDLLTFLQALKLQRGNEDSVLPRFPEWGKRGAGTDHA